jgi:polyisoprenoid-binding protein YceI
MRRSVITLLHAVLAAPFAILALSGCDTDPGKDKPRAEVSAPVSIEPSAAATASAGRYTHTFSQSDSKIAFVGAKVTTKHDGGFKAFAGTIDLVDGDPTRSSVAVEIDNGSIFTDNDRLTNHLKSGDFFDVQRFPKTRFASTSIRAGGESGATHTVTGNVELHGVTRAIAFPATIRAAADRVEVDSEFAINRKDFGIVYPGKPDDLIEDNVLIKLELHAGRTPES